MSILLDALRKSENSQKPVEPPTIHSSDHGMGEAEPMKAGLLAILLLVALLLIGWLVWRQYSPEVEVYSPPVSLPAGKSAPIQAEPAAVATGQAQPNQAPPQVTPQQAPPQQPAKTVATAPRTPVESYEPSAAEKLAAKRQQRRDNAAAARTAKANQQSAARPVQRTAPAVTESAPQKPAANETRQAAQQEPYQSPEPQPIGYWDLPDSVRNSVPVIKFSVLVFADTPADRFVLINGSRFVEGDELKPGLVLEQIRREGAVFRYQLYRFFVER